MASEASDKMRASRWPGLLCAALLLALLGAGLGLRLWRLADGDLTEDEELATGLPMLGYGELFTSIAGRPPLAFLAQKLVIDLWGGDTSAFTLRLAGVLEGTLAIAVIFALARAVGGLRAGLLAAGLLAVSPFHIEWSRDARYYPMLALMGALTLWGYWRGGVERKVIGYPLFVAGFLGSALTHFSGYLFFAAVAATLPFVALLPGWRGVWMRHPRRTFGGLGGLVVLALPVAWLLRGYVENVTRHLGWPDLSKPLPPLFDVSPLFLWHRFGDAMGMEGIPLMGAGLLILVGLLHGARRSLLWPLLSMSVLVLPFLLFFLFPPDHPWQIKYFIFQLPVLLTNLALGMDALAGLAARGWQFSPTFVRLAGNTVAALLLAGVALSNGVQVARLYAWPAKAHQQLGADLTAWSKPEDKYFCTWKERPRILRHYCPTLQETARLKLLHAGSTFPTSLPFAGQTPWFLLDGKSETPPALAAELLSGAYSRIPYENIFLARAPGMQQAPVDVALAPGESVTLSILSPRETPRSLLLDMDAAPGGMVSAQLNDGEVWTVRTLERRRVLTAGRAVVPRGPIEVTVTNSGAVPLRCMAVALVPHLAEATPLRIPAWDFQALTGTNGLEAVWPDARPEGMMVADLRHGQALSYRFVNTEEREVVVRLQGLNDPPLPNRYQLYLANTPLDYEMVALDQEDGRFSWVESKPFKLRRGDHTLYVGHIGMSREDFLRTTRNGRAQTMESIQNPGLLAVEIAPVGH